MLYLLLQLRDDRYAIDATHIEEVIPLVHLKDLPGAPRGVAGLIDYHGHPVPVLDLSAIAHGTPTAARTSARIVIVWYEPDSPSRRLIGLLVPRATDVVRFAASAFVAAGMETPEAPYLGTVCPDAHGIVQQVRVEGLLTPEIRHALVRAQEAA